MLECRHVETPAAPRKRWILTEVAFNKLLACLDSDRQCAAEKYEQLHRKLRKFFEIHRGAAAEDLADETINRVTRKLEDGLEIQNIAGYTAGVARMILKETLKDLSKNTELRDVASTVPTDLDSTARLEKQLQCLEGCLETLPVETRRLIMEYYELRKQAKIDHRKALAEELGIPPNALRIRVHRVRAQLEECVIRCLRKARNDNMD